MREVGTDTQEKITSQQFNKMIISELTTESIASQSECVLEVEINPINSVQNIFFGLSGVSGNSFLVNVENGKLLTPEGDFVESLYKENKTIKLDVLENEYNLFIDNEPLVLGGEKNNQTFDYIVLGGDETYDANFILYGDSPEFNIYTLNDFSETTSTTTGVIENIYPDKPFKIIDIKLDDLYGGGLEISSFETGSIDSSGLFFVENVLEEVPPFKDMVLFFDTNFGRVTKTIDFNSSFVLNYLNFDLFPSGISGEIDIERGNQQEFLLYSKAPFDRNVEIGLDYDAGHQVTVDVLHQFYVYENLEMFEHNNGSFFKTFVPGECNSYSGIQTSIVSSGDFTGTATGILYGEVCEFGELYSEIPASGWVEVLVPTVQVVELSDAWLLESGLVPSGYLEFDPDVYINLNEDGVVNQDSIYSLTPSFLGAESEEYIKIKITHKENISEINNSVKFSYFHEDISGSVIIGENLYN